MFQKLTDTSYVVSAWSGGTTTQLAIYPENAVYADRDFLWRVSSATVDLEDSDFTPLPDYDRLIATLEGEIVLTHNGGAPLRLRPLEVHAFSGADATHSVGRCRDFNLMLRRGRASGTMEPLRLTEAPTRLDVGTSIACPLAAQASVAAHTGAPRDGAGSESAGTSIACPRPTPGETFLLYCVEGSCTVGTAPCCPQPAAPVGTAPSRPQPAAPVGTAPCRPQPAPACSAGSGIASLPAIPPAFSDGAPVCAAAEDFSVSLGAGETLLLTDPTPLTLTGPATLMLCRMKLI